MLSQLSLLFLKEKKTRSSREQNMTWNGKEEFTNRHGTGSTT